MLENNSTTMVMLPQSVWESVQTTLQEVKDLLVTKKKDESNSEWIDSVEARKMLGVSPKTWQTYRDERRIPFVQFGRKIFIKRGDLENFMNQHYIKSRN